MTFQLAIFCVVLFYKDIPEKWLFAPLLISALLSEILFRANFLKNPAINRNWVALSAFAIVMLAISFGYGRTRALHAVRDSHAAVRISFEGGTEEGILLGRLGAEYFFLNESSHVSILSVASVKRIDFLERTAVR